MSIHRKGDRLCAGGLRSVALAIEENLDMGLKNGRVNLEGSRVSEQPHVRVAYLCGWKIQIDIAAVIININSDF